MGFITKKKLYKNLVQRKFLYSLNTYNRLVYEEQNTIFLLRKQGIYTLYIKTQEKNIMYIKEISGILLKKSKMKNLTNLHLLSLKRYNNIYLSFPKESPNVLIKYRI